MCSVFGLSELSSSFLGTRLSLAACVSFSSPDLRFLATVGGCQALPGLRVDAHSLHVELHDVTVEQLWPPGGSSSRGQLSIQEIFGDAAVCHAVDVT